MTTQNISYLNTAVNTPLHQIEAHLLEKQALIESWFREQWLSVAAPFYASVDLRNAGFKLAPVDTNLFPAGFNNLSTDSQPLAIQAIQSSLEKMCPTAKNILLIPENHTRNQFYLESLATLAEIVDKAGYKIKIGSILENTQQAFEIDLPSNKHLNIEPIIRDQNQLHIKDFTPCVILLNNDLSGGIPEILRNLNQPILPSLELGWTQRSKSTHFSHYRDSAEEFSEIIDIDPWLINPSFRNCGKINFMKSEGTECLEHHTHELLISIQKKYDEYKIDKKPFIFIKADAGTYGMGIMTVSDVAQIKQLNRKQRTRMDSTKEGQKVQKVIIQEGIYTSETVNNDSAAEPVVYMIDRFVIGGFYRVHDGKAHDENLNSPGMHFQPIAFKEPCNTPEKNATPDTAHNRLYAYGVIARLALVAASREIAAQLNHTSANT